MHKVVSFTLLIKGAKEQYITLNNDILLVKAIVIEEPYPIVLRLHNTVLVLFHIGKNAMLWCNKVLCHLLRSKSIEDITYGTYLNQSIVGPWDGNSLR